MNKYTQTAKYVISDFISASIVWVLFNILRYKEIASFLGYDSLRSYLTDPIVEEGQLLVPLFWLVLYYFTGYYNKPFGKSRLTELFITFVSALVGVTLIFFIVILNDLPRSFHVYYQLYYTLLGLQFLITYSFRLFITQDGIRKIKTGEWAQNVLIIGTGKKAIEIAQQLKQLGYHITGYIQDDKKTEIKVDSSLVIGNLSDLSDIISFVRIHELIVAIDSNEAEKTVEILYSLYEYKLPIKILADKSNLVSKVKIKTIKGIPLVDVTDNNFSAIEENLKLLMDKVISVLVLVLLSPVYLYVSLRVKKDSEGPILFKQERIGYMGRPFIMYKFRTMYQNSEDDGPLLATENDNRITPFGRVMRKYRLDELPQFWNVLKGDMSLVGPRPERKYFIDQIVKKAPYYYLLHNVKPGITSWGMVKYGYASGVDQMIERLEYDILYYENMSLVLDLTILIYTVRTVITGKGI